MSIDIDDVPYKNVLSNEQNKEDLLFKLKQLDILLTMSGEQLKLYLIGGTACILGEYLKRSTMDMDVIDIEYSSKAGKFLSVLEPFDLLEFAHTSIAKSYTHRVRQVGEFKSLYCYILSPEDIIVSKLCRFGEKDIQDIDNLFQHSDTSLILDLIDEVKQDLENRVPRIRENFINNVQKFIERYDNNV